MEESVLGLVRIPPPLPPKTRRLPQSTTNRHLSLDAVGCQQENQHAPPTSTSCTTVYIKSSRDDLTSFPEVTQDCGEIQIGQHQSIPTPPTGHVVKIMINTSEKVKKSISTVQLTLDENKQQSDTSISQNDGCIRINVGNIDHDKEDMMKSTGITSESFIKGSVNERNSNPYFFCTGFQCSPSSIVMSSGQCSPSDTLDSGTCSDLDSTPPPIPKKKNSNEANSVSVTILNGQHKRANSLTSSGADVDSDDNESNISCDSLNSGDLLTNGISDQPEPPAMPPMIQTKSTSSSSFLPSGLLQDIRDRSAKLITPSTVNYECEEVKEKEEQEISLKPSCHIIKNSIVNESTYEDRKLQEKLNAENKECVNFTYDTDKYYKFHLNENVIENECISDVSMNKSDGDNDESFAGYKDLLGDGIPSTIRSAKGTIRGVKNRVRAGIATFLQIQSNTKSYREKDAGKVVVYTTTMGVVRDTYQRCLHVKKILRTHLVKFEERDVFMNSETQTEVRERTPRDGEMCLPQLFVDGQYIGDSEAVERLNESGELRKILKPYKSADACNTCQVCGGYRLLPCPVCNGSKKSVHRNHFTTEFVALKCMNCDEVGLVKCYAC